MGLKKSILKRLKKPVQEKIIPSGQYVKQFKKMEVYLCSRLKMTRLQLDQTIMVWARKIPIRWNRWKLIVRAGKRLEELQMFAQNYSKLKE